MSVETDTRGYSVRGFCLFVRLLYVLWLYLGWLYSIELLTAGGSCVSWAETGTWFCWKIWCAPVAPQRGRVPGRCEDMAVCCVLCLGWMLNGLNWPF